VTALGIAHIELYVNDLESAVEYLVSSFGFTPEAMSGPDKGNPNDSVLLSQGSIRLIVTAGPGTSEFLSSHGDGVADIALTCDDLAATVAAAGAPVIRGFGDVRHTLRPAAAGRPGTRPDERNWTAYPADGRPAAGRFRGPVRQLDHVAVCVPAGTLARYADFYRATLGLTRYSSEYVDFGGHAMDSVVVRSPSGGITFTLVAPDSAKGPGQLDAFLDRNGGPGVQHLAYAVPDIIAAVGEFRRRGVEFLPTPDTYYDMLAERLPDMRAAIKDLRAAGVLADRDEWGHLFQLFTQSPYERSTLFYELIQRRGARGFGSANIRSLYEAVDRAERLAAG
jgi:4-hydroxymandelate synthase